MADAAGEKREEEFLAVLKSHLRRHEGVSRFPYVDTVGVITIGIGRNLSHVGLSMDEVEYLFENDVKKAVDSARRVVGEKLFDSLSVNRKSAIANMAFNLGEAGLSKFVKFLGSIREGDFKKASREMLNSVWARQVGRRAIELSRMIRDG